MGEQLSMFGGSAGPKKARLVVDFEANISDFKKSLSELHGGHKGLVSGLLDVHSAATKTWGTIQSGVGIITDVLSSLNAFASMLDQCYEESHKFDNALQALGEERFNQYDESAKGLISSTNLLAAASKATRGELAITKSEFNSVTEAAVALSRKGFGDATTILNELTTGLSTGTTDAFKKFGIVVEEGGTIYERHNRSLAKVIEVSKGFESSIPRMEEAIQKQSIRAEERAASVRRFVGGMSLSIDGFITTMEREKIAEELYVEHSRALAAKWEAEGGFLKSLSNDMDRMNQSVDAWTKQMEFMIRTGKSADQMFRSSMAGASGVLKEGVGGLAGVVSIGTDQLRSMNEALELEKKQKAEAKQRADEAKRRREEQFRAFDAHMRFAQAVDTESERAMSSIERFWQRMDQSTKQIAWKLETATSSYADYLKGVLSGKEWLNLDNIEAVKEGLSNIFGGMAEKMSKPMTQMDQYWSGLRAQLGNWKKQITDITTSALPAFGQAAGSALMLLMSGQAGASETFKAMIHSFAEQQSIRLWGLSIESSVMALRDSIWNPPAAAAEWAAAGMATAGAAVMAGIAGVTQPSEAKATGAGGGGHSGEYTGTSKQSGSVQNVNINIGYGFIGDRKKLIRELDGMFSEGSSKGWINRSTVGRAA